MAKSLLLNTCPALALRLHYRAPYQGKGVDSNRPPERNGTWSHYLFAKYHVSAHRLKKHRDSLTFKRVSPHLKR